MQGQKEKLPKHQRPTLLGRCITYQTSEQLSQQPAGCALNESPVQPHIIITFNSARRRGHRLRAALGTDLNDSHQTGGQVVLNVRQAHSMPNDANSLGCSCTAGQQLRLYLHHHFSEQLPRAMPQASGKGGLRAVAKSTCFQCSTINRGQIQVWL